MNKRILSLGIIIVLLLTFITSINGSTSHIKSPTSSTTNLDVEVITGGVGVQAVLYNRGDDNLTNISWQITLNGGVVILGKTATGLIDILRPGRTTIIEIPLVVGFGKPEIRVTAIAAEADTAERTRTARLTGIRTTILPGDEEALTLRLDRLAQNLKAPTSVTGAGDGSDRLFIAEQTGLIKILQNGEVLATPFLDISEKMVQLNTFYDERGLLGLVFHPQYSMNGRFFVYYSAPKTAEGVDHESIIGEFSVSAEDPNLADPLSENIILRIDQPESNHNGGQLAFGPDGYLYIGLGDGGGAGDRHGDIGNGQDINTSLGAILRIDVDQASPYAIPPDNPFVGTNGLDEIYAYGFRNPYRFSFDANTRDMFVADVGQDLWEEIDLVIKGGNYGWRIVEGTHGYDPDLAVQLGIDINSLEAPIYEYSHALGRSVIGGYVYRGSVSPGLTGKYVFGDWSSGFIPGQGKIFYLEQTTPDTWTKVEFKLENNKPLNRYITGFGEDDAGEIYMLTTRLIGSLGTSGEVWHLVVE